MPSRRRFLEAGLATLAAPWAGGCAHPPPSPRLTPSSAPAAETPWAFTPLPAFHDDAVHVPEGYTVERLLPWGDPIGALAGHPAFRPDAGNSTEDQWLQAGMHHDGMAFFPLPFGGTASDHGLLAINHEYTDDGLLHANGAGGRSPWTAAQLATTQAAHGLTVVEVRREAGRWRVVPSSPYARRVTAASLMRLTGPASGHALLRTETDVTGTQVQGTLANCGSGLTPWGTYLSGEENFQGYFARSAGAVPADQRRYGLTPRGFGLRWHEFDPRFDAARHPNEPHRFGWVVELDPYDPEAPAVKRTALGRFCHENAAVTLALDGRAVVYLGDDGAFEHVYKFVSRGRFDPGNTGANRRLLDEGTLYVARFGEGGQGEWLPLVHGRRALTAADGFTDQGEVLIRARAAADAVGATPMDRPEWLAVHPATQAVYCALTGNAARGLPRRPGPDAANPRPANLHGHILRWQEQHDDPAALVFRFEVFLSGGERRAGAQGSALTCPDGLAFDPFGRLWITTDHPSSAPGGPFAAYGNNAVLIADPETRALARFLVGPAGAELNGLSFTPDGRTLFVNVQHPAAPVRLPSGPNDAGPAPPRSATLVVRRKDGGTIAA